MFFLDGRFRPGISAWDALGEMSRVGAEGPVDVECNDEDAVESMMGVLNDDGHGVPKVDSVQ